MLIEFLFNSCINKSSRYYAVRFQGNYFTHDDYGVAVNKDEEGDATSGELSSQ
jgi:hypothetical protein